MTYGHGFVGGRSGVARNRRRCGVGLLAQALSAWLLGMPCVAPLAASASADLDADVSVDALAIAGSTPTAAFAGTPDGIYRSTDTGSTWQLVGPPAAALAVAPSTPQVVYAGVADGVRKSTDGGDTWAPASVGLPGTGVGELVIGASDPLWLYAGTGIGVYRSTDGAATWTATANATAATALAVDPSAAQVLYVGTAVPDGLAKTTDGGETWAPASAGLWGFGVLTLAVDPTDPQVVYAGTWDPTGGAGVHRSTDGGDTWALVEGTSAISATAIALDPTDSQVVYAGKRLVSGSGQVCKSTDGGESWLPLVTCPIPTALAVDPLDPSLVYTGATNDGLLQSTDGGATWAWVGAGHLLPANRLVITEVNLSTWTSQVQVTDVTGGSAVQVYYDSGTSRRGPFPLWDNATGAAGSSASFTNIVATIDSLDDTGFLYDDTSGALELLTQDREHLIQAAVRTVNASEDGRSSRTFPACANVRANTAALGRELLIANLSSDSTYRPSVVLANPDSVGVAWEATVWDASGQDLGGASGTLAGHQMLVITDELRSLSFSHAVATVHVNSAGGRVMASGQTAHMVTNDPAGHVAVQLGAWYPDSPAPWKALTEVNWTQPWVSEVQLIDVTGGSTVQATYDCGGGGCEASPQRRGPFTVWANAGGPRSSVAFGNILARLDSLDAGAFDYFRTSGALTFATQDDSHLIHAAVRTHDGAGHSRTFPGLSLNEAQTAALGRSLLIPGLSENADYRCSVVLYNPTASGATAAVRVLSADGSQVGPTVVRDLQAGQMNVITSELRALSFSNATVWIDVTAGDGWILATGQTANRYSSDPAAHLAVQAQ